MTTITVKDGLKNLSTHTYNNYKDLMDELANIHGYSILWQVDDRKIPKDVLLSMKELKEEPNQKLYNI